MAKPALIIGGSPAGLQAALDLADAGVRVHLVETTPFLGKRGAATVPGHILRARMLETAKHPRIKIWTNAQVDHIEGEEGHFQASLHQHPRYIDLSVCTACGECVEVCPINTPGSDHKVIHLLEGQPHCAVIDKLGQPPCANACPGGVHVQGYVALTAQGRFQEAIDLIRDQLPFPGICGRVCTHPCEFNCRRTEEGDDPVGIRLIKRFLADWEKEHGRERSPQKTDLSKSQRVAVVGAGPGGMAVADRLARRGYSVTVFEKLPVIGGMMAAGIPSYRLPREIISRAYERVRSLGVDIRLNTAIGPDGDYTLADLFESGYEAVCLAIGAHKGRTLPIPGNDLPGVVDGIELLKAINLAERCDQVDYEDKLEELLPRGERTRAVVLGGGNTAMDASRSLKRLGLEEVGVLYRRSRAEMPALPEEVHEAEEEGVAFDFLVSPVRVLGDEQNGVTGLECVRMKLGEPDASGRPRPIPIEGSEFIVDVDLVVLAIGQRPDLGCLCAEDDIAVSPAERIAVDQNCFTTNRPGVFAVGDAVSGANMAIIEAIGMGKRAAEAIDIYLQGSDPAEELSSIEEREIAHRPMTSEELAPKPSIPVKTLPLEQRVSSFEEVELGYNAEQAIAEAQRCLVCGPCSECMACVQACQPGAIIHTQADSQNQLEVGAVIYADQPSDFCSHEGVFHLPPENEQLASAAAARVMAALFSRAPATPILSQRSETDGDPRIGVVICQCGGEISNIVDTQTILDQAEHWPSVVHTQAFNFSCSPEAAEGITRMIEHHQLDKLVLAGCACCSLDQICYSCTYQRVRCKTNLGVFDHPEHAERFEFVNIREQCAWAHRQHPFIATRKAAQLVKAAVAKIRAAEVRLAQTEPVERSVLILGNGQAGRTCRAILSQQQIDVEHITDGIENIQRLRGGYVATGEDVSGRASALVLTPEDEAERERLFAALPSAPPVWEPLDSLRPGLFYCGFDLVPEEAGAAIAARVNSWLGRTASRVARTTALVDSTRCRACSTCVELCEVGAPNLIERDGERHSWIDPVICSGCGTCAVHCPSGAITAAESSDAQLEAMLTAILT